MMFKILELFMTSYEDRKKYVRHPMINFVLSAILVGNGELFAIMPHRQSL